MKVWNSNPLKGPCGYHGGLPYHRTIEAPGTSLCWCLHDDGILSLIRDHIYGKEKILRERRYPSILLRHKIKDVLLSCCLIVLLSYCLGVLLSWCLSVLLPYCLVILLSCCLIVLLSYCLGVLFSSCVIVLVSYCFCVLLSFCLIVLVSYCLGKILWAIREH